MWSSLLHLCPSSYIVLPVVIPVPSGDLVIPTSLSGWLLVCRNVHACIPTNGVNALLIWCLCREESCHMRSGQLWVAVVLQKKLFCEWEGALLNCKPLRLLTKFPYYCGCSYGQYLDALSSSFLAIPDNVMMVALLSFLLVRSLQGSPEHQELVIQTCRRPGQLDNCTSARPVLGAGMYIQCSLGIL